MPFLLMILHLLQIALIDALTFIVERNDLSKYIHRYYYAAFLVDWSGVNGIVLPCAGVNGIVFPCAPAST